MQSSGGPALIHAAYVFSAEDPCGREQSGKLPRTAVPKLFGTRDQFSWKTVLPWTRGREDSLGMIQAHYIYRGLYFYYCNIRSASGHLTSDWRGWGPVLSEEMTLRLSEQCEIWVMWLYRWVKKKLARKGPSVEVSFHHQFLDPSLSDNSFPLS